MNFILYFFAIFYCPLNRTYGEILLSHEEEIKRFITMFVNVFGIWNRRNEYGKRIQDYCS